MSTTIYLALSAVVYFAVLAALIRRRRDIVAHPKKYAEVPGWERYRWSMWYEREHQRYGKHYRATLYYEIPGLILFLVGYMLLGTLIQKYLLIPRGALFLDSGNLLFGVIAGVFYFISFGDYLSFHSRRPLLIAARLYTHSLDKHEVAWRKMITTFTVMSALCLPVMLYAVSGWSCAGPEGLYFRDLIPAREREYRYEEMVLLRTDWSANDGRTEFSYTYALTMEDGTVLELTDCLSLGAICDVHQLLMEQSIPFQPAAIDEASYERMVARGLSREELAFLKTVFVVSQE